MRTPRVLSIILTLAVLAGMAACNLPISSTPTPFVFPTPNKTMTALFENTVVIPPTSTAQPAPTLAVVTATLAPPPASTATLPPVPTSTATLPPTPTRTSLPVNMRPGPSASAAFLSKAPVIDGPWSEWDTRAFNSDHVVFGKSNHTGGEDLGASYRVGWDNTYLYIAVKVYDDSFVQNASGASMFKGDSVEILLDTNVSGDFYSDVLSGDDFQLGISAGKGALGQNMEAYLWYPSGKAGAISGVKMAAIESPGIYRLEAAIPWTVFGVAPSSGIHFGFALSVSDNDNGGENLQQSMVSSTPDRVLGDPTTWGDLNLVK